MKEVYRSGDIVKLTWLQTTLRDAGIDAILMDEQTSSIYANGFIEQRLMVETEVAEQATQVIT